MMKRNQPLLHARVKALPWRQVPADSSTRDTGHERTETCNVKTVHVSRSPSPGPFRPSGAAAGGGHRHDLPRDRLAATSLTLPDAAAPDLARPVREH